MQIGFNVSWNQRWIKTSLSLESSLKLSMLWQWRVLFVEGIMKANTWKSPDSQHSLYWNLSCFIQLKCKRRKIFKIVMFNIKKKNSVFMYPCLAVDINSKRYLGDRFFIILKKRQSFLYHLLYWRDSKRSSW